MMELLDARLGLVAAGVAAVRSERVRKAMGRGLGYAATGVTAVGGPVVRPIASAGRDIFDEARGVTGHNSSRTGRTTRSRSSKAS